ncbi:MAG TPA: DUF4293 domain-containing protein [Chitinophagaceae bacterium]|jgi:hypothetical protein|nr:DUF4293 domain-containing protein [Chitinophagaceae bacterium]
MIQRKQTIWLLLASLSILLAFFIPFGIHNESGLETTQIVEKDLTAKSDMILMSITIASALISFITIFLFGNRKLQMSITLLAVFVAISVGAYELYFSAKTILSNKLVVGVLGSKIYLGLFVPLLTVFFLLLAFGGIRKDEKLIRDSDRLR